MSFTWGWCKILQNSFLAITLQPVLLDGQSLRILVRNLALDVVAQGLVISVKRA